MSLPIHTDAPVHNWADIVEALSAALVPLGASGAWLSRRINKRAEAHSKRLSAIEANQIKQEIRIVHLEDRSVTMTEMTASIEHMASSLVSVVQGTSDKMDKGFAEIRERLDKHIDRG